MHLISHQDLTRWLDQLAAETCLIAPQDVDGVRLYRPVEDARAIVWDEGRPVLSSKEAFFPPTERLLTIEQTGQQISLMESVPDGDCVIVGVRPCDVRGILALDALFADTDPPDTYYTTRREHTTLIGLACQEMGETCFCTSTGGAPDDPTGMDILLTAVQDGYVIQTFTAKGEALLPAITLADFTGDLPQPVRNNPVPVPPLDAWPPQFNAAYWADMAERCLSCRICAYVCPTCRCFDVRDEPLPADNGHQQYERIRCWDSCAGEVYRRIAGGHNPRAAKGDRLRNRFFCKFYYYPQQYGPLACTGCGRCIDACPVNIDITEVMHAVQQLAEVAP
jgi:sulfhydrogenase subunit beta (sulfur reductase)